MAMQKEEYNQQIQAMQLLEQQSKTTLAHTKEAKAYLLDMLNTYQLIEDDKIFLEFGGGYPGSEQSQDQFRIAGFFDAFIQELRDFPDDKITSICFNNFGDAVFNDAQLQKLGKVIADKFLFIKKLTFESARHPEFAGRLLNIIAQNLNDSFNVPELKLSSINFSIDEARTLIQAFELLKAKHISFNKIIIENCHLTRLEHIGVLATLLEHLFVTNIVISSGMTINSDPLQQEINKRLWAAIAISTADTVEISTRMSFTERSNLDEILRSINAARLAFFRSQEYFYTIDMATQRLVPIDVLKIASEFAQPNPCNVNLDGLRVTTAELTTLWEACAAAYSAPQSLLLSGGPAGTGAAAAASAAAGMQQLVEQQQAQPEAEAAAAGARPGTPAPQ